MGAFPALRRVITGIAKPANPRFDCQRAALPLILRVTILIAASLPLSETLSPKNNAPMNRNTNTLNADATHSFESSLVSSQSHIEIEESHSRSRIEPCEFERLLQRAVEILSARARNTEASSS